MTARPRIALIGDHSLSVKAHQAIPPAIELARVLGAPPCSIEWLHTSTLLDDPSGQLKQFQGVWCVPGSPYANTRGVLAAIRHARTNGVAFLGTCGGFQHALIEYAEAALALDWPAHAELDPDAVDPVIAPLACSLVEQSREIRLTPGTRLAAIYGVPVAIEAYHCSYGLNPIFRERLSGGPLRICAEDSAGDVRAIELDGHPFFIGTLFQPERSALVGQPHPLVAAFVTAAAG